MFVVVVNCFLFLNNSAGNLKEIPPRMNHNLVVGYLPLSLDFLWCLLIFMSIEYDCISIEIHKMYVKAVTTDFIFYWKLKHTRNHFKLISIHFHRNKKSYLLGQQHIQCSPLIYKRGKVTSCAVWLRLSRGLRGGVSTCFIVQIQNDATKRQFLASFVKIFKKFGQLGQLLL